VAAGATTPSASDTHTDSLNTVFLQHRPGHKSRIFINTQIGQTPVRALVDSGNLSTYDMIDFEAFMKAFPVPKDRPKVNLSTASVAVAGNKGFLKSVGIARIPVQIPEIEKPWITRALVVRDLGMPMILGYQAMRKMPIVLDLSCSVAHIGPYGVRVPLRTLEEEDPPLYEESAATPTPVPHLAVLAEDILLPPQSEKAVKVRTPDNQNSTILFIPGGEALKRKKLLGTYTLNSPVKGTQQEYLVPFFNPTKQTRRLSANTQVGVALKVKPTNEGQNSLFMASNNPTGKNLGPYPKDVNALNTKDYSTVLEALHQMIGKPTPEPPQAEQAKRKEIHSLFNDQINNNVFTGTEEKKLLEDLLYRFYNILSKSKYDVGCTDWIKFVVDTGDTKPIKDKCRPMRPEMKEDFRKTLEELLSESIVAPTDSAWASAIVPVKKKNGSWRYAVDYRRLNQCTKRDAFPVAHNLEASANNLLKRNKFFLSLDLAGAYLAIPVEEGSQDKLSMVTTEGLFAYQRMPFGAMNSGTTYARLMRMVTGDLVEKEHCLSYFDDNLIGCNTFLEGLFRFAEFLFQIEQANLRLNPKKTKLFSTSCEWLGHKISQDDLMPSEHNVSAIRDWPVPKDIKEVQTFCGKASYYRKFIPNFAHVAEPLRRLTQKDIPFTWGPEQQQAFDTLKEKLCSDPVLAQPNFESGKPFILDCDASGLAIGAVLSQEQADGSVRPIAYDSKTLSRSERNYTITKKELLAAVTFIEKWSYYLLGNKFLVRTDHQALTWLRKTNSISGQLMRWNERIQDYDFDIEYRPGKKHGNADAMSRYPHPELEDEQDIVFTDEDIAMYTELGMTPTKTGALGKYTKEQWCGVLTRAQRRQALQQEADKETEVTPDKSECHEPSVKDHETATGDTAAEQEKGEEEKTPFDSVPPADDPPPDEEEVKLPPCNCDHESPSDYTLQKLAIEDEADSHAWEDLPSDRTSDIQDKFKQSYDMVQEQAQDPVLRKVITWIEKGKLPEIDSLSNPHLRRYHRLFDKLKLIRGKLFLDDQGRLRICIPEALIPDIIRCLHQHPLAGHIGRHRTYLQGKLLFYWPGMPANIASAISGCAVCKRAKSKKPLRQVPLGQTSTAEQQRFRTYYADIVGPWPSSRAPGAKKYLLTIQDAVTKYPEAWPLHVATAESIIQTLTNEFFVRYGVGQHIKTDQGRQFVSALFKRAAAKLGVITTTTQAYSPQSNPVERLHRTLEGTIRALMDQEKASPGQWYKYVPAALASMRQTPLSNLPASPHYLVFGEDPIIPVQVLTDTLPIASGSMTIDQSIGRLREVLRQVHLKQLSNHEKNKALYDKTVRPVQLKKGDWVFKHTVDTTETGETRKLAKLQEGPYEVDEVINDRKVRINKWIETRKGKTTKATEEVSRDRLTKAHPWDLTKLSTPLAWPINKTYRKLKHVTVEEGPTPTPTSTARRATGWPFPEESISPALRPIPAAATAAQALPAVQTAPADPTGQEQEDALPALAEDVPVRGTVEPDINSEYSTTSSMDNLSGSRTPERVISPDRIRLPSSPEATPVRVMKRVREPVSTDSEQSDSARSPAGKKGHQELAPPPPLPSEDDSMSNQAQASGNSPMKFVDNVMTRIFKR